MRILQLTPGTGNFLCGSCLRDNTLATALRAQGHDALIAPLYLPFALEEPGAAREPAVHMGGINVYLQQKLGLLRRLPKFLHDRLDSPRLLRFVSKRAHMTDTTHVGPLMLSMLRGEEGRQRDELRRLVEWAGQLPQFDAVLLSNAMLAGLARELRAGLECPIFTTLQGEAPFLDSLGARHRQAAWDCLAERARELDGAFAVSRFTADLMTERLDLDPRRVHVVWNGVETAPFDAASGDRDASERDPARPTIGFVARMCRDKGLDVLFEAFLRVKRAVPSARLLAAGVVLNEDRPLLAELRRRALQLGLADDVELIGPVSREEKARVLRRCDVFSVPATYGESFGLYLLEAWASGVPVVQPRHGAFPELLAETGAGVLVAPDDADALASGLVDLLRDPERRATFGARGAAAVRDRFTAERMAEDVAALLAASPAVERSA